MIWTMLTIWGVVLLAILWLGIAKARRRTPEQERAEMTEQAEALRLEAARRERDRLLSAQWRASARRRERERCASDLQRGGGDHA